MLRSRLRADDGFSLVEILVVILIIGVLAAIALPAFLNQRSKGQDAHAKSAASTAAKAMRVYEHEHGGSFAGAQPSDLIDIEPALGQARNLGVTSTADAFTVSVDSAAGGAFSIERQVDGDSIRTCSQLGVRTCSATADAQGNHW
jgi:type IV pilus assembly protein PilA